MGNLTQAATDILEERQRQIDVEGWTPEHDDEHTVHQLSHAAACYVLTGWLTEGSLLYGEMRSRLWPWDKTWWKPKSYRENLIRGGALILAEIERLDRQCVI